MKVKKGLLIIGAGGHGKVVADIAIKMDKWENIFFVDDREITKDTLGIEVKGKTADAFLNIDKYDIFVGVGNNHMRAKIQNELEFEGARIPVLIHPDAIIGTQVEIGTGTVLMAGTVVNCCSKIGKGCIVNTGATIDHDNILEDYVHVSPGVHTAGTVMVGKGTWLGIGSIINNNVSIAGDCIIGAGAVVIEDITVAGVYVGVPAKKV